MRRRYPVWGHHFLAKKGDICWYSRVLDNKPRVIKVKISSVDNWNLMSRPRKLLGKACYYYWITPADRRLRTRKGQDGFPGHAISFGEEIFFTKREAVRDAGDWLVRSKHYYLMRNWTKFKKD